jgi:hypothetical protein
MSPKQKMQSPEGKGKKFRCRFCWSINHWGKECRHKDEAIKKLLEWHKTRPKVNAIEIEESSDNEDDPYEIEDQETDQQDSKN